MIPISDVILICIYFNSNFFFFFSIQSYSFNLIFVSFLDAMIQVPHDMEGPFSHFPSSTRVFCLWFWAHLIFLYIFFNVGPPKEDIFLTTFQWCTYILQITFQFLWASEGSFHVLHHKSLNLIGNANAPKLILRLTKALSKAPRIW